MAISRTKLTGQGQVSVPAEIRRKLSIGPGSVLEWEDDGDRIVVRRAGLFSSADIRKELFGEVPPKAKTLEELKEGVGHYVRKRYARG